ncbi:MAG: DNA-processing protein DprA [Candidatus Omnitrophota bacterium]
MPDSDYLIALNAVPGLGPARIQKLLEYFGVPQKIFQASDKEFSFCSFLPQDVAVAIKQFPLDDFLKKEHAALSKHKAFVISVFDAAYPKQLKEIADPPVVLYGKGNLGLMQEAIVAIVGCRKASVYGITTAEKLAQDLCSYNIVVASGLARGIDTAAHRGALKVQGKTIAVLGTGLSHIYPPENKKLFEAIAEKGLLISEFPMETLPKPFQFPRRNRIISGLSLGVVVVEAARKSGALITTDLALEQGREVFAVPGKVDSLSSQGVNELIKQGAKLVTCVDDITEELSFNVQLKTLVGEKPKEKENVSAGRCLSQEEQSILKLLSSHPVDVDHLCQESKLSLSCVFSALLRLELSGLVRQLPGKLFVLE